MRLSRADTIAAMIAGAGLALFCFQIVELFGRVPVAWPDEALFAQPAVLLLREGRLAAPLLAGSAAGVTERMYWYPQGYPLLLSGVFALAGPTLAAMRAVSVASAIIALAATWGLARTLGWGRLTAATAVALLATDPVFVRAALVGRPDLAALALMLLSLLGGAGQSARRELASGLAAGGAALVHPFGAIALLVVLARAVARRRRRTLLALGGAVLPLLGWAAYALQDLSSFVDQVSLNFALHEQPWDIGRVIAGVLDQYLAASMAIPLAWAIGGIGLALGSWRDRRTIPVLAAFILTTLTTLSLQMWHPTYVLPFMYLGIAHVGARLAATAAARRRGARGVARAFAVGATVAVLAGLLAVDLEQFALRSRVASGVRREAYGEWSVAISSVLPRGSRVLVGGIPDPAWGLLSDDLRLIALQDEPRAYSHFRERLSAEIDYVVLAGSVGQAWLDLVTEHATVETRVVIDTGQHDVGCPDWLPCGPLQATIYRVRRAAAP